MIQQNPTREVQLDFNINYVKEKIDAIVKVSTGSYLAQDKNDLLNTYRISVVSGILSGVMSITLKKVDDNKTEWKSETMNLAGGNTSQAILAGFQDEFLTILSKALMGAEVNRDLIKANKSGCVGVFLLLISLSGILAYLLA